MEGFRSIGVNLIQLALVFLPGGAAVAVCLWTGVFNLTDANEIPINPIQWGLALGVFVGGMLFGAFVVRLARSAQDERG